MGKEQLRERLRKQREQIQTQDRKLWDQDLHRQFWSLPKYRSAKTIMIYLSFGSEINTWPLLEQAWKDGKSVLVPKVRKYPKEIIAVEINSKTDLKPGLWGISEPINDQEFDPGLIDIVVVPGLAFDQAGYRLGYGGGYYDRFLPRVHGHQVGLCYPSFLRQIPIMPWDQKVDQVLVPSLGEKRVL